MNRLAFERGFKAEANRIAVRIRKQMGLRDYDPIDPIAVCQEFEIKVIKLSQLDCDTSEFRSDGNSIFSAVTVPCGSRLAIVHNDSHHPYRQRSNICHELAHCFLGHKYTPPLTPNGERIRNGGNEAEANYLAGSLLLTNEGALYVLRNGLKPMAQHLYGISKPMLDYRLRVSGADTIHQRSF